MQTGRLFHGIAPRHYRGLVIAVCAATVLGSITEGVVAAHAASPSLTPLSPTYQPPMTMPPSASEYLPPPTAPAHKQTSSSSTPSAAAATPTVAPTPPTDSYSSFTHSHVNGDGTVTQDVYLAPKYHRVNGRWAAADPAVSARADSVT